MACCAVRWWRGEALAGRTILLHAEQGLGDTVQFVRYVPEVAKRGGRILLLVPPASERLLRDLPGVHRVLTFGPDPPDFDFHCPLPSLPYALGMTTPDTIPAGVPYIRAEPELRERWRQRLGSLRGLRVGLTWAGTPSKATTATGPSHSGVLRRFGTCRAWTGSACK